MGKRFPCVMCFASGLVEPGSSPELLLFSPQFNSVLWSGLIFTRTEKFRGEQI